METTNNKEIVENKDITTTDNVVTTFSNNTTLPNNNKPIPPKNKNVKPSIKPKKTSYSKPRNATKKTRHIIVGKHASSESGFTFSYSESENLREILTDFVNTVDGSTNKRRAILFTNILNNLNEKSGISTAFGLIEEMFGYKIIFIGEISKVFLDKDFTTSLQNKMHSLNEPLPF